MITHRSPLHRAADTAVFWLCVAGFAIALLSAYIEAARVAQ